MPFKKLGLFEPLLRAIRTEGYTNPTAIQELAIPPVLEGRDLMGCAQTGTGKTAAFALPILQRLDRQRADTASPTQRRRPERTPDRPIRALVLSPTRELARQICDSFQAYGRHLGLRHTVVYGGVKQGPQCRALSQGIDILVATPGRLLDLLNQRKLRLDSVETFVLDEADRMLDMGFIHDIRKVIDQLPTKRQTLLFSATIPTAIETLADTLLDKPVAVSVPTESPAADTVEQAVCFVHARAKSTLLGKLLSKPEFTRTLVFSRTKHGADRIARHLSRGNIRAEAIHSNKSQNARQRALANFKRGTTRVLVASDIAARGLDVNDISHVINYDLPEEAETYVHRIGRTGRAGVQGQAISFCSNEQRKYLRGIERLLGRNIRVLEHSVSPLPQHAPPRPPARPSGRPKPRHTSNTNTQTSERRQRSANDRPQSSPAKPISRNSGKPAPRNSAKPNAKRGRKRNGARSHGGSQQSRTSKAWAK